MSSANNVEVSPVNVFWQAESESQIDLINVSDPDGTYFLINSAKDAIKYYVWFNLGAGSTDPAPAGRTAVPIAVTSGDASNVIATAVAAALTALPAFAASASGAVVSVKNAANGLTEDVADVDSGVVVTTVRRGKDYDLGLLESDLELNFSPSNLTVTAHQTGVTPRASLFQGFETLEVSTTLLETKNSNLKSIYGIYGGAFTPAAGTEVFGVGTVTQGNNLLIDAARLVLKPVNASDDTKNINLMLAVPVPDSLVFSGENPRTLGVTWQGFIDETKDSRVSALLFGDASQSGL